VIISPEARAIAPDGIAFIERKLAVYEPLPALAFTVAISNAAVPRVRFTVSTPNRRPTVITGLVADEKVPAAVAYARPSCVYDRETQVWNCPDPLMTLDEHLREVLSAGAALARTGEPNARHSAIALIQQQAPELSVVAYATEGPVELFTRAVRNPAR
jgi:hypothetical protein